MMKLKIKLGDTVEIVSGADKGKKGTLLVLDSKKLKVKVSGVRMQTKFDKEDGMKKLEGFIDYSNVKFISAATKKKAKKTTSAKAKA